MVSQRVGHSRLLLPEGGDRYFLPRQSSFLLFFVGELLMVFFFGGVGVRCGGGVVGVDVGGVGGLDGEVLLLAGGVGRILRLRQGRLGRRALPRLLLFSYWSFVFLVILFGVINNLLKFFIDADNCIIGVLVPSVQADVVFGGGLDLDPALADHGVAERLEEF
jgi:hypothetical protein